MPFMQRQPKYISMNTSRQMFWNMACCAYRWKIWLCISVKNWCTTRKMPFCISAQNIFLFLNKLKSSSNKSNFKLDNDTHTCLNYWLSSASESAIERGIFNLVQRLLSIVIRETSPPSHFPCFALINLRRPAGR